MTYYKVVKVVEDVGGSKHRMSVVRGGEMKVTYIPQEWVVPPARLASEGALLFVYRDLDALINDISAHSWDKSCVEIWECAVGHVMDVYCVLESVFTTELSGSVVIKQLSPCFPGVAVAGQVKLTKMLASMSALSDGEVSSMDHGTRVSRTHSYLNKESEKESNVEAKVEYKHYRPHMGAIAGLKRGSTPVGVAERYYRGNAGFIPDPRGGVTVCTITDEAGNEYIGTGNCSVTDVFCFSEGRAWAFKDAIDSLLAGHDMEPVAIKPKKDELIWYMPLEAGKTIARWLKTVVNSKKYSDTARNELYKALGYVQVSGIPPKD